MVIKWKDAVFLCQCCGSIVCDRCGTAMHITYEWNDCTTQYTCFACDRHYYEYYAGKPNYAHGSLQKLWFVLMKKYWND